jgi:hypothetical protein
MKNIKELFFLSIIISSFSSYDNISSEIDLKKMKQKEI